LSPLLPNILRILVLAEVCNKSSKLSFRVLLPEPVMSITSMSWMRLSLIFVRSRVKPEPASLRVSIPPPPSTRARLPAPVFSSAAMLLALMIVQVMSMAMA
jgi:hypothetical protein